MKFDSFVNRKLRQDMKNLKIIAKLLRKKGFEVKSFLEKEDPYIFVKSPEKELSFGGIRIYKVGNYIAYRIQREERTHPYGESYPLEIEEMYKDYLAEEMDEKKAGKKIIEDVSEIIKDFFKSSAMAEKELGSGQDKDSILIRSMGGSDYSNSIYRK